MTVRTLTAVVGRHGIMYDVPTLRDLPDGVTADEAQEVIDAAVTLAELTLIEDGSVPGESCTVRVFYTEAERRAAADLTQ